MDEIRMRTINTGLFASVQRTGKLAVSDFISQTFDGDLDRQLHRQFLCDPIAQHSLLYCDKRSMDLAHHMLDVQCQFLQVLRSVALKTLVMPTTTEL